jgi:class 3 adenylate cyclase
MPEPQTKSQQRWFQHRWFTQGLLVLLLTLLGSLLTRFAIFERFEVATYDWRMAHRPQRAISDRVVSCDIDDEALRVYGRWPWPRSHLAELVSILTRTRAKSILLDLEFTERSLPSLSVDQDGRTAIAELRQRVEEHCARLEQLTERPAEGALLAPSGAVSASSLATAPGAPASLRELGSEFEVRAGRALQELERSVTDHDARLAQALKDSGTVFGVCYLNAASHEAGLDSRQLEAGLRRLVGDTPGVQPQQLPEEFRALTGLPRLLSEAKLRRVLREEPELETARAAARSGVETSLVEECLETFRAELLREEMDRSVDERPEQPFAFHEAALATKLRLGRPERLRTQLRSLHDLALSCRLTLAKGGHAVPANQTQMALFEAVDLSPPIAPLAEAFAGICFSNQMKDLDGAVRRTPLLWSVKGRLLKSPGLMMAMASLGAAPDTLRLSPGPRLEFGERAENRRSIPIDTQGRMLVNWAGPWGVLRHISAAGLRDALELERAYLAKLRNMDRTGLADRLAQLVSNCQPWKSGDPGVSSPSGSRTTGPAVRVATALELERQILDGHEQKLQYLQTKLDADGGATDERSLARQHKRREALDAARSLLDAARELRHQLVERFALIESLVGDRVCLVGASAVGLTDLISTPYQPVYPGVGTHGNVADTILTGAFVQRMPGGQSAAMTGLLLLTNGLLVAQASPLAALLLMSALFAAFWLLAWSLLGSHGLWIPVVAPGLTLVLYSGLSVALRYFWERHQRVEAERMFGYYLSPEVIRQLREDPSRLKRGGEEVEITALFTDLAGFSTVSERMSPTQVVELINDYLGDCTEVMMARQGTLERYEGDAIRAMFGAPIVQPDHAVQACLAGLEMQQVVGTLRERHKDTNRPEFQMRLGLNTGRAVVGNIGARNRFNFTMQGDSVNTAARLEGANKHYGTQMMIGEATWLQARAAIEARELDLVRVAGRKTVMRIYELICKKGDLDPALQPVLELYSEGLELYRKRQWKPARERFTRALEQGRADPPSQILLERCRQYELSPPPDDWAGVTDLKK